MFNAYQGKETGTLTISVQSENCNTDRPQFEIQEMRTGIFEYRGNSTQGEPVTREITETRNFVVYHDDPGIQLWYHDQPFPRYHAANLDTVMVNTGHLIDSDIGSGTGCSTHDSSMELVRNVGMVSFAGGCGRASYNYRLTLNLVDTQVQRPAGMQTLFSSP